jgi:hypothetical protein
MELNSNYRDRNMFQDPASFEVNISQTGMRNNEKALDPITYSYPEIIFSPSNFKNVPLQFVKLSNYNEIQNLSSTTTFVVSSRVSSLLITTPLVFIDNYYNGSMLLLNVSETDVLISYLYARRIIEWKVLQSDTVQVTIEGTIPDAIFVNDINMLIMNPTDISDTTKPFMFIPTAFSIDNYYIKFVIWNQTQNKSVSIMSFDKVTHLAQLGDITGYGFTNDDVYTVRKIAPNDYGTLAVSTIPASNSFNISQFISNSFINSFVRLYNISVPGTTNNPIISGKSNTNANIIIKIIKVAGAHTIILDKPIPSYTGVPANYKYEIMQFSIDNYSPFTYNGSLTSQSQPVAHELSLNSLILPNVRLKSGGRIAYYPYVYVELENISATTSSNSNVLHTNNPYVSKAVFKIPITDLNHPAVSPFVKLTGTMKQTMTFKQNDNMRVAVRLPNGSIFTTVQSDTSYGQEPNPFLQLSFCFGMERI